MRKCLAENIFLIGGTTMMMGLMTRLKDEMLSLLKNDEIYKEKLHIQSLKFHAAPSKPNFTAWLGGSIYGGTELVLSKSLTRELYAKNPHVPDWTTYEENRMHGCN
jgi:actin-related protein 10